MENILLIDIGNTSAKVAVARDGEIVLFERLNGTWSETIGTLQAEYGLQRCVVSNVAGEQPELKAALQDAELPAVWIAYDTPCGLKGVPEGYGADRLAADVGAIAQAAGHTTLVIDAGTCITYDLFLSDGTLTGGVISPGVQTRLNAMHHFTALLPQYQADTEAPVMGTDTRSAMMSSAVNGVRYEVEGYIRDLLRSYPDLRVFLTGGNEVSLPEDLRSICTYQPDLLLRGLLQF